MNRQDTKQTAAAGTMSPKQKHVRSKSRSSGERCMSDQSDTDMDTSVKSDQQQATTPTPMLVDKEHSETAENAFPDGTAPLIFNLHVFITLSSDAICVLTKDLNCLTILCSWEREGKREKGRSSTH